MKTGEKTYFDLDVVQLSDSILGVLLDDIKHLPLINGFMVRRLAWVLMANR